MMKKVLHNMISPLETSMLVNIRHHLKIQRLIINFSWKTLTLEDEMPRGNLVPVISHNILRSPENTVLPVLQSIFDGVGEGFVVSSYQPV